MGLTDIINHIDNLISHITFEFEGINCGIDPISINRYDMWCGDVAVTVKSLDEVLNEPLFRGASLKEIVDKIENIDM